MTAKIGMKFGGSYKCQCCGVWRVVGAFRWEGHPQTGHKIPAEACKDCEARGGPPPSNKEIDPRTVARNEEAYARMRADREAAQR